MLISRASPTLLTLACPLAQQLTLSSFLWRCIMTIHHTQKVCTLTLFKTCKIGKCARHTCFSLHCTANRANTKLRLIFPCSVVQLLVPGVFLTALKSLTWSQWDIQIYKELWTRWIHPLLSLHSSCYLSLFSFCWEIQSDWERAAQHSVREQHREWAFYFFLAFF